MLLQVRVNICVLEWIQHFLSPAIDLLGFSFSLHVIECFAYLVGNSKKSHWVSSLNVILISCMASSHYISHVYCISLMHNEHAGIDWRFLWIKALTKVSVNMHKWINGKYGFCSALSRYLKLDFLKYYTTYIIFVLVYFLPYDYIYRTLERIHVESSRFCSLPLSQAGRWW